MSQDPGCAQNYLELPDFVLHKAKGVLAATSVVCSLSIVGSLLIIFSYVFFRNLRTRARYILVHLSITDLVLAVSNLVGVAANLGVTQDLESGSKRMNHSNEIDDTIPCKAQGFLTLYSTLSSVLWTILLAIFVFILVTAGNPKRITRCLMWSCYLLCYGLPLLPSLWALLTWRIGYAPLQSAGWCTLKSHQVYQFDIETDHKQGNSSSIYCAETNVYANVLAYNLWIVLAFCVIVLTYLSIHCQVTNKGKMIALRTDKHADDYWEVMNNIDYKFAAIPFAFILIRIWSLISDILYVYVGKSPTGLPRWLVYLLMYLLGIGNSAQGFVDAIIFVVFTHQVRRSMIFCFCRWLRPKHHSLIINSDVNRSINSYQPKRYQAEQCAVNPNSYKDKLVPTTSVTSNYVSQYTDDPFNESDNGD